MANNTIPPKPPIVSTSTATSLQTTRREREPGSLNKGIMAEKEDLHTTQTPSQTKRFFQRTWQGLGNGVQTFKNKFTKKEEADDNKSVASPERVKTIEPKKGNEAKRVGPSNPEEDYAYIHFVKPNN